MEMENGEMEMNDTVYGVSRGLVQMYTVGCADLSAAPSLTIVTCVTVGAGVRPPARLGACAGTRPAPEVNHNAGAHCAPYGYLRCP